MQATELLTLPLLAGLRESDLSELMSAPHRRREYESGEVVMQAGGAVQSLMVLTSGSVVTRMGSDEGREVVMDRLVAPCVLAPAFLFATDNALPVEVMAEERCVVWMLNREGFVRFMAAHSEVMSRFMRMVSDRSRFLSEKVRTFAIKGLHNRVLDYLRTHGSITHVADTAAYLGVARPSFSHVLAEMVNEGLLRRTDDGIILAQYTR